MARGSSAAARVRRAVLFGGTHGNELTGVTVVRRRQADAGFVAFTDGALPKPRTPETFELAAVISNPAAVEANRRYIDFDLNRCFGAADLADRDRAGYEWQRAQVLNAAFGPKGATDPACQFAIDLHSTTAGLGGTVIIRESDAVARVVAAQVCAAVPGVRLMTYLVSESRGAAPAGGGPAAAGSADDYPYLSEIAPHGIEIEVGPVPQGVVRAETVILTERILNAIIEALDCWNRDERVGLPSSIAAYRYEASVDFPRDASGRATAMIHPDLQDCDFTPLAAGDPLFLHLDGTTIRYDGEPGLFPVFVNEAAYYEKHAALTLCREVTIPVIA